MRKGFMKRLLLHGMDPTLLVGCASHVQPSSPDPETPKPTVEIYVIEMPIVETPQLTPAIAPTATAKPTQPVVASADIDSCTWDTETVSVLAKAIAGLPDEVEQLDVTAFLCVIDNRKNDASGMWPSTWRNVVKQDGQFQCYSRNYKFTAEQYTTVIDFLNRVHAVNTRQITREQAGFYISTDCVFYRLTADKRHIISRPRYESYENEQRADGTFTAADGSD